MATIDKAITIDAPIEKVYAYLDDPMHLPVFWPSMIEVKDVKPLVNGGHRFQILYKMVGNRIEAVTETVDRKLNELIVRRTEGDVESTFNWDFLPVGGTTKLHLKVDYKVPTKLAAKAPETFIVHENEREADLILTNLKELLEL